MMSDDHAQIESKATVGDVETISQASLSKSYSQPSLLGFMNYQNDINPVAEKSSHFDDLLGKSNIYHATSLKEHAEVQIASGKAELSKPTCIRKLSLSDTQYAAYLQSNYDTLYRRRNRTFSLVNLQYFWKSSHIVDLYKNFAGEQLADEDENDYLTGRHTMELYRHSLAHDHVDSEQSSSRAKKNLEAAVDSELGYRKKKLGFIRQKKGYQILYDAKNAEEPSSDVDKGDGSDDRSDIGIEGLTMEKKTTDISAGIMLIKSFVGTGVLFLPKAFLNGGFLFSSIALLISGSLSLLSYLLLIKARSKIIASYGDMGGILCGDFVRHIIVWAIALSQLGFASTYIIFTAKNLSDLLIYFTGGAIDINSVFIYIAEFIFFVPFVLVRNMQRLSLTALVGNIFIFTGLLFILGYDIKTIADNGISQDIVKQNENWPITLGTLVFAFEGIGILIPIQESMMRPERFPLILVVAISFIAALLMMVGLLSYLAFGNATMDIVLENLPTESFPVNLIKIMYLMAILLSVPLQLYPVIRIVETHIVHRSGKYNVRVKWYKNTLRASITLFCIVLAYIGASRLDSFVSLVGSMACVPLVFIFPPMIHMKSYAVSAKTKILDLTFIIFGVLVMLFSSFLTVSSWFGSEISQVNISI